MEKYYSALKAASLLGVSGTTIIRWVEEGRFPNVLKYEGADRATIRIPQSDIDAIKQNKKSEAS